MVAASNRFAMACPECSAVVLPSRIEITDGAPVYGYTCEPCTSFWNETTPIRRRLDEPTDAPLAAIS